MNKEEAQAFKALIFIFIFILAVCIYPCVSYVGPGYCGVSVNLLSTSDEIQETPLSTGLHFLAPWKQVWKFPLFDQNVSWEGSESFRFQTAEGLASNADIGVTFSIDPIFVPIIFKKYRSGIHEISQKFMRNYLRDAITVASSSRNIEELYGRGKEKFLMDVQEKVQEYLRPLGINVSRIYLVDAFKFPNSVVDALNRKIEASQRAEQRENELREAQAQAQKEIAKSQGEAQSQIVEARGTAEATLLKAKAESEANHLLSESITRDLLIYELIHQWDGNLPKVFSDKAFMYDGSELFKK